MRDDFVKLRVHQGLAARNGDHRRAQRRELIKLAFHYIQWNRIRHLVIFIAIPAREITATHRDDMCENRMICRKKPTRNKARFSKLSAKKCALLHLFIYFVTPRTTARSWHDS